MPAQTTQMQRMVPYIIAAVVILVLLIGLIFWPSKSPEPVTPAQPADPIQVETPTEPEDALPQDEETPFEPLPDMQEVVIGEEGADGLDMAPPVIEVEPAELEPLDVSDNAIKLAIQEITSSPTIMRLLVSDDLLQKFVINVNDIANGDSPVRSELVERPAQEFRVYQQGSSTYIEPSSFQRYTPYVDALEAVNTEQLVALLEDYRAEIETRFSEIARPGQDFDQTLLNAINTLLDTPQVPVPYEVYSDSVAYKFKDERLEALPGPQKQLLRTGPENIRRIKNVLREIKQELEE